MRAMLDLVRFFSLLFVALTLGLVFSHVMELPGKLRLDGADWLTVQHNLYVAFGVVGAAIEVLAIVLVWLLVFLVRARKPAWRWTLIAALCVSAGLGVWFWLVSPMNAALNAWTPETLPPDWTRYRDQWEIGHAIHAALFGLGFGALVIALLGETRALAR
ncbi:MAG: hypothetical protein ACOY3L_09245 [Pseudomonadota bacterium]